MGSGVGVGIGVGVGVEVGRGWKGVVVISCPGFEKIMGCSCMDAESENK